MKKNILFFFTVALLLYSCSTSKNSTSIERDGTSFEKAIIIQEKSETTGVDAEYKWIAEHYPGYTTDIQSLYHKGKKSYDIIKIKTASGEEKSVYFDITRFFGKF